MARKIEQEMEQLGLLREGPHDAAVVALRKALKDRVNLMVAKAAKTIAVMELRVLAPEMLQAYGRLFEDGAKCDPQCWGKNALAIALRDLGHTDSSTFLRGAKWVQMEPTYGGSVDTAITLRGICLLALLGCTDLRRGDLLRALVDAFNDEAAPVRVEVARALERMEGDEGALLLRLKARFGDAEPQVIGQVFDSLLKLELERALAFVGGFMRIETAVREEAALALGSSRLPGAVDLLQEAWKTAKDPGFRQAILRAFGISRQERAIQTLLEVVRTGRAQDAECALEALAIDQGSPEIRRQAYEAATESGPSILALFSQYFR